MELPKRVVVAESVTRRYGNKSRPLSWDKRRDGVETIKTTDDQTLSLYCEGGQESPERGWELLLTGKKSLDASTEAESSAEALTWTLYGIKAEKQMEA